MTTIQNYYTTQPGYNTGYNNGYNPYGGGVYTDPNNGGNSLSNPFKGGDFSAISSMAAHAAAGGFTGMKLGGQMSESIKSLFGKTPKPPADNPAASGIKNIGSGFKGIAMTGLKGAGFGALVSAGVSAVANGAGMAMGQVDGSQAAKNVLTDSISGALGGFTAVTASGLVGLLPVPGVVGTVLKVGVGAIGGVLGGQMAKSLTEGFN